MIEVSAGPLIVRPVAWNVCFCRKASSRLRSFLAFGHYKHVRAYAYVPYLHVWVFYDVHLAGTDIFVAADGDPAHRMIALWLQDADVVAMAPPRRRVFPTFGFCVPSIRSLLGLPGGALRPDALFRQCLANGGTLIEASDGRTGAETAAA